MAEDHRVLAREGGELVGMGEEGLARERLDLGGDQRVEGGRGVEARAHGRAAEREEAQGLCRQQDIVHGGLDEAAPAGDLLAERDGHGIHEMRAAALDDALVLALQTLELVDERPRGGQHRPGEREHGGDMHGRGERVVGGLRAVDVVVGVDRALERDAAFRRQLVRAGGHDLVHVHVGLRARSGLPDLEREVAVEVSREQLVAGVGDEGPDGGVEHAELDVGLGGGLLEDAERGDDPSGHGLGADGEVLEAPLRLGTPERICGNQHLPHGVALDAHLGHHAPPSVRTDAHKHSPKPAANLRLPSLQSRSETIPAPSACLSSIKVPFVTLGGKTGDYCQRFRRYGYH